MCITCPTQKGSFAVLTYQLSQVWACIFRTEYILVAELREKAVNIGAVTSKDSTPPLAAIYFARTRYDRGTSHSNACCTTNHPRACTTRGNLVWSDPSLVSYAETWRYRVHYKCSNDSYWNMTAWLIQTKLTLNSKSFQNYLPYDLCQFCVIARAFEMNGTSSKPLCEDSRLHEEPPSGAPTIMCPENEC